MGLLARLLGVDRPSHTIYRYRGQRNGRDLYSVCRVIEDRGGDLLVQDSDGRRWLVGVCDPYYTEEFGYGSIFYANEACEVSDVR